ncbi:hypothetical protein G5V59_05540 [Nocardioides sp. W3-2-3]|uniref:hypothetical protein n=1 Tax=Nocardioides convexus TaxID=2712224 RepID=UPI002418965F|nr:hypothetical protein [Nocardioides convexus]NGZ99899.1 hypothetical protein [Nocardioides convexus]
MRNIITNKALPEPDRRDHGAGLRTGLHLRAGARPAADLATGRGQGRVSPRPAGSSRARP